MRTAWETFPIEFKGGLMTNVSPLQQGINFPGSATQLINFEPSIEGGYKKISGYEKWSEFAIPGSGFVIGGIATDQTNAIVVRAGKYYTSLDKADWVERLNIGDTTGQKIRHTTFNFNGTTKVVMVDGVHKPVYYRADTHAITHDTAAPTDVQGATRVAQYKDRLWFAKGSNIIYTAPFNELDYTPANDGGIINVGDRVVGIVPFRDQLIIFCVDQIKRLVGSSSADYQLLNITKKTGAMCGDTIQEVGGDILYLGPDGIRYLSATERNEDFGLQRASEAIQADVVDAFSQCGGLNYASMVVRNKAQYRIFRYDETMSTESSSGFLGTRFQDQQASGISWAQVKGFKVFTSDSKQFGSTEVCIFTNENNYLYQAEFGNSFDGANISCSFKTPYMPVTDPQIRKTFYKHTLYTKARGTVFINLRLSLDYENAGVIQPPVFTIEQDLGNTAVYGTSLYGSSYYGSILKFVYKDQVVGSGFTVALVYSESSTNPPFTLDTAILEFKQNDRK